MGIYLNPGFDNLMTDRRGDNYIDKSMLIKELNGFIRKPDPLICVSRPRRFGKTMAANMICAYYTKGCDSHEAFRGLKIADDPSFEEHINRYNVIFIDCGEMYCNKPEGWTTAQMINYCVVPEFIRAYPELEFPMECNLAMAISRVYSDTNEKFVIIMDEYDIVIREQDSADLPSYIKLLNGLFKSNSLSNAIALAYITGILPIIRDSVQSKLNNFKEFTMVNARRLAPFIGFTREETEYLAAKNGMDMVELERWYDGYCINGIELYSPKSVIEAVENRKCDDYWTQTGAFDAVSNYVDLNLEGLRDDVVLMLGGQHIPVTVSRYKNTMNDFGRKDDVFTYLIHLGYLAYDEKTRTCRIPNLEIIQEWGWLIGSCGRYRNVYRIVETSGKLYEATVALDAQAVAEGLSKSHELMTSNMSYNNEQSLQSAIMLAYFYAYSYYTIIPECPAGKGYADIIMIPAVPGKPALVIELKRDKTAEEAMEQIKSRSYPSALEKYRGNTVLVAVNYDSKTKIHTALLERA
ncbi:MAG: AAA family ATPase [Bullifex sp.]|nr:AAA family ATPase [Bullifex sp.]